MKKYILIILSFFLLFSFAGIHAQIITTIAGNGGYIDTIVHGLPATAVGLDWPYAITVDSTGNVYFTDLYLSTVDKVTPSGTITTIAGSGIAGFSPDGTQATDASFGYLDAIAIDAHGNIYFAEAGGTGRIITINSSGIISTVAGGASLACYCEGGPATTAAFNFITGIAVDRWGNIYIADYSDQVIRKVSGGIITTLAGRYHVFGHSGDGGPATAAELNYPTAVAVDSMGNVYIGEDRYLRKINTSGIISTIAGTSLTGFSGDGGPATLAQINDIEGIATNKQGNVFMSDAGNNVIRVINTSGVINTYAGTDTMGGFSGDGGPANLATFNGPEGVAIDGSGCLYITDIANHRVRKVSAPTATPLLNKSSPGMQLYPNPVINKTFNFKITTPTNEEASITITNILGQQVFSSICPTNTATNFSINVPPGIYIITATTKESKINKKLVVE